MFKKLKSLGGGSKARQKFRLDVTVAELEGLPEEVARCRVVWARQAKVSVTKTVPTNKGHANFNEELSQIATLSRDSRGGYDSKEYQFKLQAPERGNAAKFVTLGKAALDMARFTGDSPSRPQSVKLKMGLAQGRTAVLTVLVSSAPVKGMGGDDDSVSVGGSVVSGVSGLSGIEQDLSGFDGLSSRRASTLTAGASGLACVTEESSEAAAAALASPGGKVSLDGGDSTARQLDAELAASRERLSSASEGLVRANGSINGTPAAAAAAGPAAAELAQENERLKQEVEQLKASASTSEVAALQQQKRELQEELAAVKAAASAPSEALQDAMEDLQERNKQLEVQVSSLSAAAAAGAGAGVAGAALAGAASSSSSSGAELAAARARVSELEAQLASQLAGGDSAIISNADGIQKLQRDLQSAQATIGALQEELTAVKSSTALSQQSSEAGGSGVSPEIAAKLALYEDKIQQLVRMVEEQPQSDREAELEARLREAEERLAQYEEGGEGVDAAVRHRLVSTEQELEEAEKMATEALNLLEAAQADNAHLHDQLNQMRLDSEWQQKKAAKEKADWEARMQDGFRRVEESVLLAERLQKDKDDLQARYDQLLAERDALEAQLDPSARDQQVAAEVALAQVVAEQQARIEVEALQQRVKEMEEFVEKADAARLEMAAKVSELTARLAAVRRDEQQSFDQVKSAEERADSLMLELQYLQHENKRLQGELSLSRAAEERAVATADREVGATEARVGELAAQLADAKAALRAAETERGDLHSQRLVLEEQLESTRLQLATTAVASGAVAGAAGEGLLRDLEERQRAAEARATQLELTARELSQVRGELQRSDAERDSLAHALREAERAAASTQARLAQLEEAARAREVQAAQMEQLQRDMAAAMLAAKEHSGAATSLGLHKDALESQLAEAKSAHDAEVAALAQQLEEAQRLADYSSKELAGVVQQLAAAEGERKELADRVADLRDDLARLRTGDEGELRVRIEKLEKELIVIRNARDVNALFKTEHDRIATELIETKLLWAEAQEQIVKLKQSLVKSQEKQLSFASKLTKLETKFYKRLKEKKEEKAQKKRDKAAASGTSGADSSS